MRGMSKVCYRYVMLNDTVVITQIRFAQVSKY